VHGWWWGLVGVGAVALVTLLVAEPWTPVETEPVPTHTTAPSVPPDPSATPSVSVPPAGSSALFDATTGPGLFVTAADLVADVPAAKPSVEPFGLPGETPWGLSADSTVEPVECSLAVTVVSSPPSWFDSRSWHNETLYYVQDVVLLPDPASASAAFAQLVTAVDACPEYTVSAPDFEGAAVSAAPAIEGQGVYPSIVARETNVVEGNVIPQYQGHMLVGNTIVSWVAQALTQTEPDAALATLGDPESLSAMVQDRAQLAVRALG
jgi:hypothetical protein